MRKSKNVLIAGAAVSLLLASFPAAAGLRLNYEVVIDATQRYAFGSMAAARNSSDPFQAIGCVINARPGNAYIQCQARDANDNYATCFAGPPIPPEMLAALQTLTSEALIYFAWDQNSQCTDMFVTVMSYHPPKSP